MFGLKPYDKISSNISGGAYYRLTGGWAELSIFFLPHSNLATVRECDDSETDPGVKYAVIQIEEDPIQDNPPPLIWPVSSSLGS
jgi:hypothetical protein